MGLDTVELVMEFEDAFGVSIPDRDAERMRTVGETADWLCVTLAVRPAPPKTCESRRQFYRLRRGMLKERLGPRRRLRPSTPVAAAVARPTDVPRWGRALRRLNLADARWPAARRPQSAFGPVPHGDRTLGDLARRLARLRDPAELYIDGRVSREAVVERVRWIVAEQFGLPVDAIGESSDYINDLGAG